MTLASAGTWWLLAAQRRLHALLAAEEGVHGKGRKNAYQQGKANPDNEPFYVGIIHNRSLRIRRATNSVRLRAAPTIRLFARA